jgi:hypothetical protein
MTALLIALHSAFLLLAAIVVGASIGGFLGGVAMIIGAVLAILLWGTFAGFTIHAIRLAAGSNTDAALRWASRMLWIAIVLSAVTGLGLAFLSFVGCGPTWLPSLYHWGGLIGTVVATVMFFCLPPIVSALASSGGEHAKSHHWAWALFLPIGLALVWGLAWLIAYLVLSDDVKESQYAAADRVYKLPFPGGESSWVIQGNNTSLNHEGTQKFAWDFRRRCGTPVLAARAGTVLEVTDDHDGLGGENNKIRIEHDDKTVAFYLHIQKDSGARLKVGAKVQQGDEIAKVGSVGNSLTGHIHLMVQRDGNGVPVSFQDVRGDKGIPRTFSSYTSGNR